MHDILYKSINAVFIILILMGIKLMISPFTKKILLKENEIVYKGIFTTKIIKFDNISNIKFSKIRGLIFKNNKSCIVFGPFMGGLIFMIKYIEKNIKGNQCEQTVDSAKKMLEMNHIEF